jgi:hypothetical protein
LTFSEKFVIINTTNKEKRFSIMKKITINEKTKKIISTCIIAVIILGIAVATFVGGWYAHKEAVKEYTVDAIVTEIIVDRSEVFFETTSGHIFYVVTDEIFAQFESYSITFDTMGTPTVEDDEIVLITRELKMD